MGETLPRIEKRGPSWVVHTTCGVYCIPKNVKIRSIAYGFDSIIVTWEGENSIYVRHGMRSRMREELYELLKRTLL